MAKLSSRMFSLSEILTLQSDDDIDKQEISLFISYNLDRKSEDGEDSDGNYTSVTVSQ